MAEKSESEFKSLVSRLVGNEKHLVAFLEAGVVPAELGGKLQPSEGADLELLRAKARELTEQAFGIMSHTSDGTFLRQAIAEAHKYGEEDQCMLEFSRELSLIAQAMDSSASDEGWHLAGASEVRTSVDKRCDNTACLDKKCEDGPCTNGTCPDYYPCRDGPCTNTKACTDFGCRDVGCENSGDSCNDFRHIEDDGSVVKAADYSCTNSGGSCVDADCVDAGPCTNSSQTDCTDDSGCINR